MAKYAVILDLDGTLAYTIDDIHTAIVRMLERLGYETRTKDEVLSFINNGARFLISRSLPKDAQDSEMIVDTALALYEEEYSRCYAEKTHAYDGLEEALSLLKRETRVKLAVLSNKQDKFVKEIVKKLFPEDLFEMVCGLNKMPPKPDPTSILHIAKKLGVKPQNCILVGDSDVDIRTAKNAEITSVGVSWGYRDASVLEETGADFVVSTPEDLFQILHEKTERKPKKK